MTAAPTDPLDAVTIPVPCTVPWDSMTGDDRVRFCGACRLHVHDLSAMTRDEAVAFLARGAAAGGRVCARFRRRPDGRVVTDDCARVVRALRRRARIVAAAVVGALGLGGIAWARNSSSSSSHPSDLWNREPFRTIADVLPDAWFPNRFPVVAGRIVCTPPPAQNPPTPSQSGPAAESDGERR